MNIHDPAADVLDSIWDEEWRKNIVDVAMQKVRRRVSPEHYQLFHLHAVKGLGVRDVARLTGASVANVYVTYHRISHQIKKEVRLLESKDAYA